ncbi:uncharacterized protein [Medicago truncatula]|uniref:uncharacterized protein isoform X2 n=1 Tax=Medicago truncatula TaxID=3880 RepID=UPI0019673CFA|nr:uncharacterized protein LOC25479698 isoform X2 [Medicago truncatula]
MSSNNYEYICPNHRLIRNLGGNGTMVTIQYSGVKLVSIRRFHWVKGERRPSKGISLTVQQWLNLKKNMDAIEKAYHERSAYSESDPDDEIVVCDLGSSKDGHKMVCVKSWKKQIRIDIRECYFEDGIRKNGRKVACYGGVA